MLPPSEPLDQARWSGLLHRLGAQQAGLPLWDHLTSAYREPGRVYHTAEHIGDCLYQFDLSRELARRPDEVEAALWFHDAVYVPGRSDNEVQSADLARASLLDSGVAPDVAGRVRELVLMTQHLRICSEADSQLLCDVDLSIFGRPREVFDEFERRIRREYAWVAESVYRSGRSEVLAGFLSRHRIYQTDYFRALYEIQARTNLERLLKELAA